MSELMKHTTDSPDMILVTANNPFTEVGPEIDFEVALFRKLKKRIDVGLVLLSDGKGLTGTDRLFFRSPVLDYSLLWWRGLFGQRFALVRTLISYRGLVGCTSMPVTLTAIIIRAIVGSRIRLTTWLHGMPANGLLRVVYRLLSVVVLRNCEAVSSDELSGAFPIVMRYSRHAIPMPNVLLPEYESNSTLRTILRNSMGINNEFVLGIVGSFKGRNRYKIDYIISNLARFNEGTFFTFIGDFDGLPIANKRFRFLGRVPNLMESFRVLDAILILRERVTLSPMSKMIYAMHAGIPVVTNSDEGLGAISGRDALIGEDDTLPKLVNLLIDDAQLRLQVSENGRRLVESLYGEKKMAPFLEYVDQALRNHRY